MTLLKNSLSKEDFSLLKDDLNAKDAGTSSKVSVVSLLSTGIIPFDGRRGRASC